MDSSIPESDLFVAHAGFACGSLIDRLGSEIRRFRRQISRFGFSSFVKRAGRCPPIRNQSYSQTASNEE